MNYSLRELDARLLQHYIGVADEYRGQVQPDGTTKWGGFPCVYMRRVETVAEADSIMFLCPLCFEKNGGEVGTHSVLVSFAGREIPEGAGSVGFDGKPTRWQVSGNTLDDLVCMPSILLKQPGCEWHGFIGSSGIPAGRAG